MSTHDSKDVVTAIGGVPAYSWGYTSPSGPVTAPAFLSAQGWESKDSFRSVDNTGWRFVHDAATRKRHGFTGDDTARLTRLDLGNGAFRKVSARISNLSHPYHTVLPHGTLGYYYSGPFLPTRSETILSQVRSLCNWMDEETYTSTMIGLGTTAINRTIPTKANMSLAVSLAELRREGLPKLMSALSLRQTQRSPVKNVAGEYLNYQFGWAPIIADVRDLLITVRDSGRILKEYTRLAEHHTRRRYDFGTETKAIDWTSANDFAPYPSVSSHLYQGGFGTGKLTISGTLATHSWFSGAYRFSIPQGNTLKDDLLRWEQEANKLLGIRLTPEVLWNVTSWSWLLDWFLNIGDVISNLSYLGRDGLVLQYGYVMRHTRADVAVSMQGVRPYGDTSNRPFSVDFALEQKQRLKATPYGFGLNPESFSPKQWSIIGALLVTRAPGKL